MGIQLALFSWWTLKFIMRILFDLSMISILVFSGLFWQAGTMEQLIHCFCALEQVTQSGLRAAASYLANEGVSGK